MPGDRDVLAARCIREPAADKGFHFEHVNALLEA
jgi:hypothetical protein